MAEDLSSLGEDDLHRLVQVIQTLEHSDFDFLELEVGGMKVVLGKGEPPAHAASLGSGSAAQSAIATAPAPALQHSGPVVAESGVDRVRARAEPAADARSEQVPPAQPSTHADEAGVEITAPMMGMFYTHPKPGEPPYVEIGSVVQPDTTVALLEVMKMFNAVPAGVEGTVVAILAEDNHLVEYGQPLFRVRPA